MDSDSTLAAKTIKDNALVAAELDSVTNHSKMTKEGNERVSRAPSHIPRLQRSASLRLKSSDINSSMVSTTKNGHSLRRSHSFSSSMEKTNTLVNAKEDYSHHHQRRSSSEFDDDDGSSVKSFASSNNSLASCDLGSTISGRRSTASVGCKKYVLHCQRPVPQTDEKYLTPTQRKDKQIRQLKAALVRATRGCEEKSVEVERLKSEVERLRFSYSVASGNGSHICESPLLAMEDNLATPPRAEPEEPAKTINNKMSLDSIDENEDQVDGCVSPNLKIRNLNSLEDSGILNDILDGVGRLSSSDAISPTSSEEPLQNSSDMQSAFSRNCPSERSLRLSNKMESNDLEKARECRETQTENLKEDLYKDREDGYQSNLSSLNCLSTTVSPNEAPDTLWQSLENIRRSHAQECQELKEKHNDKVEDLLLKLGDLNSRYFEVRSAYEKALERIRILDTQVSELRKEMSSQEEWHSQMYLKMYRKGQEAAKFEHADEVLEFAHKAPKRVSVPELLQQLQMANRELEQMKQLYRCELYRRRTNGSSQPPESSFVSTGAGQGHVGAGHSVDRSAEYTLKFLKDAVYYYLTEKDNRGHLQAIESILGFSDVEKKNVAKAIRRNIRLV